MTTDEALAFLAAHQPMPATSEFDEATVAQYDHIRHFFRQHPDSRCVPLFLHAFGEGDCHGIYALVDDTLRAHPSSVVIPHIAQALCSPIRSVRYWSAQIAMSHADESFIEPLSAMLNGASNSLQDFDEQLAAADALDAIKSPRARAALNDAMRTRLPPEVAEHIASFHLT